MAVEKALDGANPLVVSRLRLESALDVMEQVFSQVDAHTIRERLKNCESICVEICPGECRLCPIHMRCSRDTSKQ